MVTRDAYLVTRNGVTQSLASPVSARRDAAEALLVTRVTRDAGTLYPPYLKRGRGNAQGRHTQEGPALRVTIVTTHRGAPSHDQATRPGADNSTSTSRSMK